MQKYTITQDVSKTRPVALGIQSPLQQIEASSLLSDKLSYSPLVVSCSKMIKAAIIWIETIPINYNQIHIVNISVELLKIRRFHVQC